ncbi:membrane protein insertase YidC [Sphingosinicella microcystinivorans]|uniref:Membrane protein insertase YidC n=1 Tax=Sphingosinicella microcystinivorans TaxID=335406 RepID=A0AAD1D5Y8_SPHMI|nr:membrane protein insertase YidC [Sphingosinicella microcystinivorans]RKS90930.1 protein translocase subunit yidC [Sphingosinicella microcystinivorans]BBE33849.1 membrane protein insertase YidC [Sphingosinicella microcystinivorans]
MSDNRNMFLAILLSIVVLFGWAAISERFFPTPKSNEPVSTAQQTDPAAPIADTPATLRDRAAVIAEGTRVAIRTPALSGSINLTGARIDDLLLLRHDETLKKDSPNVRLFSPSGTQGAYFAEFGWTGSSGLPNAETRWAANAPTLTPEQSVTLSWTNDAGQTFLIALSVDKDYLFTAKQSVVNKGGQALVARPYGLVARVGTGPDKSTFNAHTGPIGVFGGKTDYDNNYDDVDEAPNRQLDFRSKGGWIGFTDKYWLSALIPANDATFDGNFRGGGDQRYQAGVRGEPLAVGPGQTASTTMRLFAGAKEVDVLDRYQDDLGIVRLGSAIDWGWFEVIAKPIFHLLDWLFEKVGNLGVAIICLTILIRFVLFPIANKQYASMAKMRQVQPKMKALQERYKDDKLKLQQEMMELYKTEKVNPLAGCLPILLQIPIFYALYKTLFLVIDMRHQPFYLWIKDLSAPDPLTPVNLFGLLPFTPPTWIGIGVLPILLGITMWLQQKLNPQPLDEIQQKVFAILPWMFMIIMAPFAAGLQLYWTVNNIISIAQQWVLIRKHPAPAPEPAKAK